MPTIPEFLKKRIQELPLQAGVYFFLSRERHILYIGKARSIRKRVGGHFRFFGEVSKEGKMLSEVGRIDFIETSSEAEALLLEASLVKENMPKYNQELKDDKSYPFLKVTAEEYPRLLIVRRRKPDGSKYFGPYTSAHLLREAVKMLRREFPLRTCKKLPKKVCLMFHLGLCGGPCEGHQGRADYLATVRELEAFLEGRRSAMVKNLSRRMKEHSKKKEYEEAKLLYEQIRALSVIPAGRVQKHDPLDVLFLIRETLDLPKTPLRIEGFDISNTSGKEAVGSMVVFLDGAPARREYRRFRIKTVEGIDDYRMMNEVLLRRYSGSLSSKTSLPDLVLIDGGKGHLAAAKEALDALGLTQLPVVSIAKQHEHLFLPGGPSPIILPQSSPVLNLLQHLRDEAHRFAIRYHRNLRGKTALGLKTRK